MASSSYPYNQLKTQKDGIDARAKSSIQKAKKEEQNTRALEDDLKKARTTSSGADNTPLTLKFQEFIYGIKSVGARYNVDVGAIITKDGRSTGTSVRELSAVAVPLTAAPGVKVVTIELRGKVKSVDDFKRFLDFIAKQNISIASVTMARDSFAVTVDLYGV